MTPTRIAVAGFTSRLARRITVNLLQKPGVEVVGICRDPAKVPEDIARNLRVQTWKAEYKDSTTLRKALRGVSTCVCCYHGAESLMVEGQQVLIDACIAESVPRYLASDFSFDFRGLKMGQFPFKDFQITIKDFLQKKESQGRMQPVHILVGGFIEAVLTPFMGILDPESKTIRYWGTGDEPWDMTSMEDIARFTAEVACDQNATGVLKGKRMLYMSLLTSNLPLQSEEIANPSKKWVAFSKTSTGSRSRTRGWGPWKSFTRRWFPRGKKDRRTPSPGWACTTITLPSTARPC